MNKFNPLFEAMNDMDDNVVSEAVKAKKHPIRTKAMLIAAAVAAASLMVGFAYRTLLASGVELNGEPLFDYNISVQEDMRLPTREEMLAWGAEEYGDFSQGMYIFRKDGLPGELFEMFNIHPLINDNFTEEITRLEVNALLHSPESAHSATFTYTLTDKQTQLSVKFFLHCLYGNCKNCENGMQTSYQIDNDNKERVNYEVVELNDGSKAIVTDYEFGDGRQATADFAYNGIYYSLEAYGTYIDGMKQILTDLGVL